MIDTELIGEKRRIKHEKKIFYHFALIMLRNINIIIRKLHQDLLPIRFLRI